ncbi:MAG: hypothetical protein IPM82_25960 [Saprospiraceae bacterium]|nr:hypothetical protein [Saprospiraceae bacterium]
MTEHELLLGKILCGWSIEQPVPGRLRLSKAQSDECEAMLQAIIQHWGAIGNASPAGLREGYFEREGRLTQSELGWVLRVEQRSGLDLLLDRLPWGISISNCLGCKGF